jgi:hypothetical protein
MVSPRGSGVRERSGIAAGGSSEATLERRYRRLLFLLPPDYRRERGEELIATMMDTSAPGQRMPRPGDVTDLFTAGMRRRLGLGRVAGFDAGLRLAAPTALALAAGIALFVWWRVEPVSPTPPGGIGGYRTIGPFAYAAWLAAAFGRATLRPSVGRGLIAAAIAVTLSMIPVAAALGRDRPPLWVIMSLVGFGLVALAGSSPMATGGVISTDERLSVGLGPFAVAICASLVTKIWPPADRSWGHYYQPTISRVGTVVAGTVGAVALIAVVQSLRPRSNRTRSSRTAVDWFWATLVLALPGGWLGPFDTSTWRLATAEAQVPRFGRLAQILFATVVVLAAMAWLGRRRPDLARPARPVRVDAVGEAARPGTAVGAGGIRHWHPPVRAGAGLTVVAATALGSTGAFIVYIGLTSLLGGAGAGWRQSITVPMLSTLGVLVVLATVTAVDLRRPGSVRLALGAAALALVGALAAACYDNNWHPWGWPHLPVTATLVSTVGIAPVGLCCATAVRSWLSLRPARQTRVVRVAAASVGHQIPAQQVAGRRPAGRPAGLQAGLGVSGFRVAGLGAIRVRALVAALVSAGWLAVVTLPYLFAWGPVLLVLAACATAVLIARPRPLPSRSS